MKTYESAKIEIIDFESMGIETTDILIDSNLLPGGGDQTELT